MGKHKEKVIEKLDEILKNQDEILAALKPEPQTEDAPEEPPGNDDPPRP